MDTRLLLLFVVVLSSMRVGPVTYQGLTCAEPAPGYVQQLRHYFSAADILQVCPSSVELAWRVGNEVFVTLLAVILTLLLGAVPSVARDVLSRIQAWRQCPSRCRHCGCTPCQTKRPRPWKPSGPLPKSEANYSKRSTAMSLFNCGLNISATLTNEIPQDGLYWERRSRQPFGEDDLSLFPLCVQRQIEYWYPLPR